MSRLKHIGREFVPLYDSSGKFLQYISHAHGMAMERGGEVEALRSQRYGTERVTGYRETRDRRSPVRGSMSLF